MKALVCSVGTVFVSKGRPDVELKLNLFGVAKLTVFLLVGVRWGLAGVSLAVLASTLTGAPVQQWLANGLLGLAHRTYLKALVVPAVATTALGLMLVGWRWAATAFGLADWLVIAGAAPLALATYMGAVTLMGFDWIALVRQVAGRPAPAVTEQAS
jgi:hypothetical protein